MTTDITALVQRLKVAAKNGCCHTLFPDDCLALVEALEKARQKIIALQQRHEVDPRTHEIIDLKERITELESEVEKWKQESEAWEQVAEKQLATAIELESRTVTVKLPDFRHEHFNSDWGEHDAEAYQVALREALTAAGIKVEAE
ncbi:hypothetical protein E1753_28880 [Klebsiella pneumoniae]|uniref:hypothetical protein n=1 Tax=Klebsiella pneumoniae TaxID=573 RepID=UPI0010918CE6|nr:hypothetical protein [Klebsiella pneumoniae]TGO97566.1 hypothetical protein E1753_28880 [Klebsiella pneumoniae]